MKIPVHNIDPLPLFVNQFKNYNNIVVVSPDIGGVIRAHKLVELLNMDFVVINKKRHISGECFMSEIIENVRGKHCILIDDIIDTGETLCKAVKLIFKKGASNVHAAVTHAVLSLASLPKIEDTFSDSSFHITNTIAHDRLSSKIKLIKIDDILADTIDSSIR